MDLVEKVSRFGSRQVCQFTKMFNRLSLMSWLDYISCSKTNHLSAPFYRLAPALPDSGQDFSAIELQEARLVISWSMEDEVRKTKLYVRTNLLQVLLRVVGDEPATMSLVCHSRRPALHFARIRDICLVFGGERQCSPDACVAISTVKIRVKRHPDLDWALKRLRVMARGLCRFLYRAR